MTSAIRHLSFELRVTAGAGELSYRLAEARPLVDGIALHSGYCFHVARLIGYGLRDADIDIYTCGCGDAGCARIDEHVQLRLAGDAMTWTFPDDPFRKGLAPALFPADAPLTIRFARDQYAAALDDIKRQLVALAIDGGPTVALAPTPYPDSEASVTETLQKNREWADARLEGLARNRALFGDLYDQDVLIQFDDGRRQGIDIVVLAQHLAYQRHLETGEARDSILARVIVPAWRADAANIFADLKAQPWEDVFMYIFDVEPAAAASSPRADDAIVIDWRPASFSLRATA